MRGSFERLKTEGYVTGDILGVMGNHEYMFKPRPQYTPIGGLHPEDAHLFVDDEDVDPLKAYVGVVDERQRRSSPAEVLFRIIMRVVLVRMVLVHHARRRSALVQTLH